MEKTGGFALAPQTMLLRQQTGNKTGSPRRESPAPISPHPPNPHEVGVVIIHDQLWPAVGRICDRKFFGLGWRFRLHSGSTLDLAMTWLAPLSWPGLAASFLQLTCGQPA